MVKNKGLLSEKSLSAKKEKKKFSKNSSFSGVESKKSPKNRRKSIATVLPTPLKKKKEKSSNEWTVSDSGTSDTSVKRKQLVITEDDVEINIPLLKTPKIKNKKGSDTSIRLSEKKKLAAKSPKPKKQAVLNGTKKTGRKENKLEGINEIEPDQKFGIEAKDVAKAIKAVIKLHKENPKLKNQLFNDPIEVSLQVSCHNIPRGPSRIIRIPLPNSILTPDSEVCLIVPELKGVKNLEHDQHIEHYENLLRNKGVENIKKIMTFHQFRTEYETYEQKSRLVDLYDMFLVDGRISGKVVKKCGKIFYRKCKVPTSVKLQATKLKEQIDKALSKAFFLLHLKGDCYNVKFGHDKMQTQELVDNAFAVIECLNKEFPGGFENIKGLHVSSLRSTSIPIYSSFKNPTEVSTPKIKAKTPKSLQTVEGELTTQLNAHVVVKPTGQVLVQRTKIDKEDNGEGKDVDVQVDVKKNEGKIGKNRKRKQTGVVSTGSDETVEANSGEVVKKKKVKTNRGNFEVKSDENVVKKKKQKINKSKEVKLEEKKSKTDVSKKQKKNKKKVKDQS